MKKLILFIVLAGTLASFAQDNEAKRVTWRALKRLKNVSSIPERLVGINGQKVRMRGYMVPLGNSEKGVVEFLLVPTAGACIHVPPPPPNQIVYVKMPEDAPVRHTWDPVRVIGKLTIANRRSQYGDAYFQIDATEVQ